MRITLLVPVRTATTAPAAGSTDLAVKMVPANWTARLKTDRVAIFRTSASRAFRVAALIAAVAGDLAAVIALVVADLVVAALEDLEAEVADSGAGAET